jgi:hypothetical protein
VLSNFTTSREALVHTVRNTLSENQVLLEEDFVTKFLRV